MIVTSLALLFAAADAPAAPSAACPYALVARDPTGRRTNVHRTPTRASGKVAKLGSGSVVYVCAARGSWLGVLFAQGRHKCRGTASGIDLPSASGCAKGWVERHRIAIVAR